MPATAEILPTATRMAFEPEPVEEIKSIEGEELEEVSLEEKVSQAAERTAKEVTDVLVAAETEPDVNPVVETEQQPIAKINIDVVRGSANMESQEQKPAVEIASIEPQVDPAGTKIEINTVPAELPVVEPAPVEPVVEKIPVINVSETQETPGTPPTPEVTEEPAVVKTETAEKPEVSSAEKEKINAAFEDIGRRILKGWQENADIDEITGGICYVIEKYRTDTGDKELNFFDPTIQALDTVSKQLMIVEESGKANKKIELKNPEEAEGVFTVTATVLKDLPKLGQENRGKLRNFLYTLGERVNNRSIEDKLVEI